MLVPSARITASGRGRPDRESLTTPLTEPVCASNDASGRSHASTTRRILLLTPTLRTVLTTVGMAVLLSGFRAGVPRCCVRSLERKRDNNAAGSPTVLVVWDGRSVSPGTATSLDCSGCGAATVAVIRQSSMARRAAATPLTLGVTRRPIMSHRERQPRTTCALRRAFAAMAVLCVATPALGQRPISYDSVAALEAPAPTS